MSRLLVVVATLLVVFTSTASALKCYQCARAQGNASGPCEANPFVPNAQGVEIVDCAASCEVRKLTSAIVGQPVKVERLCSENKHENNCTTFAPHHDGTTARFEITLCHCNEDNCNGIDPVAPVLPSVQPHPIKCWGCGHHEHGNGTCEKEPFDPNAANVRTLDCVTSCAITKTTRPAEGDRPARIHVTRECALEYAAQDKCHKITSTLDSDKSITYEWCTCNTEKCNAEASIVQSGAVTRHAVAGATTFLFICMAYLL